MVFGNHRVARHVPISSRFGGRPWARRALRRHNSEGRRGRHMRRHTHCRRSTNEPPGQQRGRLLVIVGRRVHRGAYSQRQRGAYRRRQKRRYMYSRTCGRVAIKTTRLPPATRSRRTGLRGRTRRRQTNTGRTNVTMNSRRHRRTPAVRRFLRFGSGANRVDIPVQASPQCQRATYSGHRTYTRSNGEHSRSYNQSTP